MPSMSEQIFRNDINFFKEFEERAHIDEEDDSDMEMQ